MIETLKPNSLISPKPAKSAREVGSRNFSLYKLSTPFCCEGWHFSKCGTPSGSWTLVVRSQTLAPKAETLPENSCGFACSSSFSSFFGVAPVLCARELQHRADNFAQSKLKLLHHVCNISIESNLKCDASKAPVFQPRPCNSCFVLGLVSFKTDSAADHGAALVAREEGASPSGPPASKP